MPPETLLQSLRVAWYSSITGKVLISLTGVGGLCVALGALLLIGALDLQDMIGTWGRQDSPGVPSGTWDGGRWHRPIRPGDPGWGAWWGLIGVEQWALLLILGGLILAAACLYPFVARPR